MIRILFIEKDLTTADLLVPSLERKGYQVFLAHTRRQAVSRLPSVHPDVVVVDVISFGVRGYKIMEAVRARLGKTPLILLLENGYACAASTDEVYMTPPFTSRKLLYRLKKVTQHLANREIQAGPLALDPMTRMLRKGNEASRLRPKEAELLAFFIDNSGKVVSRKKIMKEIWQTDYMGDTRTLNVHIRWLRLKIEDEPSSPRYLRTVRGVGYRFEVPDAAPQASTAS